MRRGSTMQAKTFPSMCVNERLPKWRQFSLQPLTPVVCVPPGVLELGGGVAQDAPTAGLLLALQPPHAVGWITKHMVIGWFVSFVCPTVVHAVLCDVCGEPQVFMADPSCQRVIPRPCYFGLSDMWECVVSRVATVCLHLCAVVEAGCL